MQCITMAQIYVILCLIQRLCDPLMVWRVVKVCLDDVGSRTQTVVDRLLGVKKSVGDKLCLVGISNGVIW